MNLEGASVLVTGASGFVGFRLVDTLVSRGARVNVLLRDGAQAERFENLGCQAFIGDLTMPRSLVPAVHACSLVFHVAVSFGGLEEERRVNVEGTLSLLEAASSGGGQRFVYVSSCRMSVKEILIKQLRRKGRRSHSSLAALIIWKLR